jgi:hypothetical protein
MTTSEKASDRAMTPMLAGSRRSRWFRYEKSAVSAIKPAARCNKLMPSPGAPGAAAQASKGIVFMRGIASGFLVYPGRKGAAGSDAGWLTLR